MTCPSAEELAALYDGKLKRALARTLRDHLAGCPRCAGEFATLHRMLRTALLPEVPRTLAQRARSLARQTALPVSAPLDERVSPRKPRPLSRD